MWPRRLREEVGVDTGCDVCHSPTSSPSLSEVLPPLPLPSRLLPGETTVSAFRQGREGQRDSEATSGRAQSQNQAWSWASWELQPGPAWVGGTCFQATFGLGPCSVVASCSCPAGHTDTLRSALSRRSQERTPGVPFACRPGLLHRQWGGFG